ALPPERAGDRAAAHCARARAYFQLGCLEPALSDAERAVELFQNGDAGLAEALSRRGEIQAALGRLGPAVADASQAVELYAGLGDRPALARACQRLALALQTSRDLTGALEACARAVSLRDGETETEGRAELARSLITRAELLLATGDLPAAGGA